MAGVEVIARLRPAGQLFNAYGFGGYVAWRLGPALAGVALLLFGLVWEPKR